MAAGEAPLRFNNRDAAYLVAGAANSSTPSPCRGVLHYMVRSSLFSAPMSFCSYLQSRGGPSDDRMFRDGPPRMEGWSTWSGRERSSHSRFPPVPRVRLVTFLFLVFSLPYFPSPVFPQALSRRHCVDVSRAHHLFFSIGPLASFNEAATRVRAPSRFGFARHRY
jgi:hypothetical protein